MEEIDKIIIDSLRDLHCDIDEDIFSLKQFNPEKVVSAIACCLEAIEPTFTLPHTLPASMSLRLKIATEMAQHIKELGFKGDMGYQTILYYNEIEIRRVLMFLIERLPREVNKEIQNEEIGYVPILIKKIEESIKLAFDNMWIPSSHLRFGVRFHGDKYLRQNCGTSFPLCTEDLEIPRVDQPNSEAIKSYWSHYVPDVTKQCTVENLIPSLLFKDTDFSVIKLRFVRIPEKCSSSELDQDKVDVDNLNNVDICMESAEISLNKQKEASLSETQKLSTEVEACKNKLASLQSELKVAENKLTQLINLKSKDEQMLKDTISDINLKSKTLAILSKEDNMEKLKKMVETGNDRLIDLANQWKQIQGPLLEKYRSMQSAMNDQECRVQEEQKKLESMLEKKEQLNTELWEKEKMEKQLIQDYEKLKRTTNRSAYTKRILEIIGNIKKQDDEIHKILRDTKEVQKEINTLNGQLDRSFTLSDELIFRNAKHDEASRKAYKLLATLHTYCGEIVKAATDLGLSERESKNLQEQVDAEIAREIGVKLEQVTADLAQVRMETASLLKQKQEQ